MADPQRSSPWLKPWHPFLIGIFPILSLLGHNIIEMAPVESLRGMAAAFVLVGGVLLITQVFTGWTWARAGLLASLFAILFFSYGHVYALVEGASLFGLLLGRHLILGPIWGLAFLAGLWGITRVQKTATFTRALNLMGLTLLVVPLLQISAHELTLLTSQNNPGNREPAQGAGSGRTQPDVYYIVLDAYTRDDTLLDLFEYDNTPFLQALEARGFYIPHCSRSNYARTFLSLSSTLNMDYVQEISPSYDSGELTALIKDNAVRRAMADRGYTIVAFDAGYFRTKWPDADVWLSYKSGGALRAVNEFEVLVIDTTALLFMLDANVVLGGSPLEFLYESVKMERYNRVNYIFDTLETVVRRASPKFVFVHVPSPHEPYIFDAAGAFRPDMDDPLAGYRDQVAYINQRTLAAIDAILAGSPQPPIIILQGDHGANETKSDSRRLNILNAYHLPGEAQARLYPTITPINTFRLILDAYFGEDTKLLPDVSYFSIPGEDYTFTIAPDSRPGCGEE